MNSMLFRLKIAQTQCPVRRGQILAKCSDTKLPLEQQRKLDDTFTDSLNNAATASFFYVASVSHQRSKKAGKSFDLYRMALKPVNWDRTKNNWVVAKEEGSESPHPFDISVSSEELYDHFGMISRDTYAHLASEGFIKSYIREMCKKYRPQIFDESYDYDKIFKGVANKAMGHSPVPLNDSDKEDVIQSALIDTITPESLKAFDSSKGDLIKFFSGIFRLKVLTGLKYFNEYETHKKNPDFKSDEDSGMEAPDSMDEMADEEHMGIEEEVSYKDMVDGFKKFLRGQSVGKGYLIPVFEGILLGKKGVELHQELDVSEVYLSKLIKKIKIYLVNYALQSGNDLLYSLAKQMVGPDSITSSETEVNALLDEARQMPVIFIQVHIGI